MSRLSDPARRRLLTVPEVADLLRVCQRTVWRLIEKDELRCRRIGRRVLIAAADLDALLNRPR